MKKSLRSVFGLLAALSLLIFASCEVGLGESVDLEAPEITITSPLPNAKVGCNVVLEGTCSDNVGVTEVIVSNNITGEVYGRAQLSHDTWRMPLTLDEGEVELKCQVKDKADNASSKSIRTILLLVDETAPDSLSWYIERGAGIQLALESKEKLEKKDLSSAENKYVPQNQEFTIYGNFYDAMSIDTITLVLSENGKKIISKTVTAENKNDGNYIGDGKSIFAPAFHFTHDELVAADASLASGKHYLQAYYYTSDDHNNSSEQTLEYLLWYPESDYPGIQQSATVSDMLFVTIGSSIPLHFFDDDELAEVGYDFRKQTECTGITLENLRTSIADKIQTVSGKVDYPVQVPAGEVKDFFNLLAYAKDIYGKETVRIINTTVSDNTTPMLIIETPQENSIPSMHNGTMFNIAGYSYDSSGSKSVKIAYIPSGDIQARAQALFNGATPAAGELYDEYTFSLVKTKLPGDIWYKESFSFEFNLEDFGEKAKENKTFVIQLEDTDGNIVLKNFSLRGDNIVPVINIASPSANGIVCDYRNKDLTLKFKATKTNGLGINPSKYSIKRKNHTEEWTIANNGLTGPDSNGYYSVTIPKATLLYWAETEVDVQPVFNFSAEDILGNTGSDQRTVVLSPLPVLEKVTVDKPSGKYPADTKLILQAKFSDSVKVTGTPRILLGGIAGVSGSQYAVYKTGTGTDTLSFEYTVPENAKTAENEKVVCSGSGIDLNGGKIETGVAGTGDASVAFVSGYNFWDADTDHSDVSAAIELDGVKPYISSISVSKIDGADPVADSDGRYYCNKNREILLNVAFSEAVTVSGSPVLKIGSTDFTFQSISGQNAQFLHKVVDGENAVLVSYDIANCISSAHRKLITDSTGNELKVGSSSGSGTGTLGLVLDTTPPNLPVVSGIENNVAYNTSQTITVTKNANDSDIKTYQYSIDGGLTWNEYSASNEPTLPEEGKTSGSYAIKARVIDKAGNISAPSDKIEITVNLSFPNLLEVSIAKVDGKYKAGESIEFKVFLDDVVEPYSAGAATISFKGITKSSNVTRTVSVDASADKTNKLTFTYTVSSGTDSITADDFEGVQISALDFGTIKDRYNNYGNDNTTQIVNKLKESTAHREKLILDGKAPAVSQFILNNNTINGTTNSWLDYSAGTDKVSSSPNTANNFVIKLKFDEEIVRESGTIILQRKGNWAIPPVMDSPTFLKWYNKMSVTDREKLMQTTAGNGSGGEKLNVKTGQPIGPYKKITHGLIESGTKLVPDKDPKYVLDFQYGLYDDVSNSTVVSDIRNALKSVDYDKHTVEVKDVKLINSETGEHSDNENVPNNVIVITFPDKIEDGQNWELIIPGNSIHDKAGNYFTGFKLSTDTTRPSASQFSLWSNKVAKPVVRVDRYSHGMGAKGLAPSGEGENITWTETEITGWTSPNATTYADNSGSNLKPLGYAKVRIDSETPGAAIYYQNISGGSASSENFKWASKNVTDRRNSGQYVINSVTDKSNDDDTHKSSILDIAKNSLEFSSGGTSYTEFISVGDTSSDEARFKTARKDYVSAYATKDGFNDSDNGWEGIFKTVIIVYKNNTANQINIEGGTAPGGEPIVSGFPVRDATSEERYSKNAYHFTEDFTYTVSTENVSGERTEADANFFAWVSYDIITDWSILQHRSNYSSKYPSHSYGQVIFLSNYSTWE